MVLVIETERLLIEDATEQDVAGLLQVALSNPEFTGDHEGTDGEAVRFDRDMLERDLAVAWTDPARHPLVLRDRSDPTRIIGWAEVLDEHPRDRVPWIGLLEVHRQDQRRGYGREAAAALAAWARTGGAAAVRVGVDAGNDAGLAFWSSAGYSEVDQRERVSPAGRVGVTVLELRLVADY